MAGGGGAGRVWLFGPAVGQQARKPPLSYFFFGLFSSTLGELLPIHPLPLTPSTPPACLLPLHQLGAEHPGEKEKKQEG